MQHTVTAEEHGITLLRFLRANLNFSSKMIKHLKFMPGGITVNGEHATVRRILHEDDVIELATEDTESAPIAPVDLPIEILYEDDDLVVPSKVGTSISAPRVASTKVSGTSQWISYPSRRKTECSLT